MRLTCQSTRVTVLLSPEELILWLLAHAKADMVTS